MKRFNRIALLITLCLFIGWFIIFLIWAFLHPTKEHPPLAMAYFVAIITSAWVIIGAVNFIVFFDEVKLEVIKFINQ